MKQLRNHTMSSPTKHQGQASLEFALILTVGLFIFILVTTMDGGIKEISNQKSSDILARAEATVHFNHGVEISPFTGDGVHIPPYDFSPLEFSIPEWDIIDPFISFIEDAIVAALFNEVFSFLEVNPDFNAVQNGVNRAAVVAAQQAVLGQEITFEGIATAAAVGAIQSGQFQQGLQALYAGGETQGNWWENPETADTAFSSSNNWGNIAASGTQGALASYAQTGDGEAALYAGISSAWASETVQSGIEGWFTESLGMGKVAASASTGAVQGSVSAGINSAQNDFDNVGLLMVGGAATGAFGSAGVQDSMFGDANWAGQMLQATTNAGVNSSINTLVSGQEFNGEMILITAAAAGVMNGVGQVWQAGKKAWNESETGKAVNETVDDITLKDERESFKQGVSDSISGAKDSLGLGGSENGGPTQTQEGGAQPQGGTVNPSDVGVAEGHLVEGSALAGGGEPSPQASGGGSDSPASTTSQSGGGSPAIGEGADTAATASQVASDISDSNSGLGSAILAGGIVVAAFWAADVNSKSDDSSSSDSSGGDSSNSPPPPSSGASPSGSSSSGGTSTAGGSAGSTGPGGIDTSGGTQGLAKLAGSSSSQKEATASKSNARLSRSPHSLDTEKILKSPALKRLRADRNKSKAMVKFMIGRRLLNTYRSQLKASGTSDERISEILQSPAIQQQIEEIVSSEDVDEAIEAKLDELLDEDNLRLAIEEMRQKRIKEHALAVELHARETSRQKKDTSNVFQPGENDSELKGFLERLLSGDSGIGAGI